MSSAHSIINRALNDRFNKVSNAISLAQGFSQTLYTLVRATNLAFEQGDKTLSGSWHYILDIDEAKKGTPLRPKGSKSMVLTLNLHDTCTSDLRRKLVPLKEQSLALVFRANGEVTALTTKKIMVNEEDQKLKPLRSEKFSIQKPNKLEEFVASWLRGNLDAKTMVEIQNQLEMQDEKDVDNLWLWTPEQRDRLFKSPKP